MRINVTRMSTRGQVVIPDKVRKELKLKAGDVFTVSLNKNGEIALKRIEAK